MKNIEHNIENVFAFNIKNEVVHVSEVESGRKGYYCMGCRREMQAKKGEIMIHHFSHDPKDTIKKGKCTFSDETYRHKLAKDILQRIKELKVPALFKYPPKGTEGRPDKIKDSTTIVAHTVRNELFFYEDDLEYKQARNIETHIKRMKSRVYIVNLKKYPEIIVKLKIKYGS